MGDSLTINNIHLTPFLSLKIPHPLECLNISVSTRCSLNCRFCGYQKSRIPQQIMPGKLFRSIINKSVQFGHRVFNLTPLIGEVLLDPGFPDKLFYLDNHPEVKYFFFTSNITEADNPFFIHLNRLKKLNWFSVSLYGQNPADYKKMTGASVSEFNKVLDNLDALSKMQGLAKKCEIRVREPGPNQATAPTLRCIELLNRLESRGFQIRNGVRFMNWGGSIGKNDIIELDLEFKAIDIQRKMPCVFLFHKPTILPNGDINGCSCGDAQGQLNIGNLEKEEFNYIFSASNEKYLQLLLTQFSSRFRRPCATCSGYRSINKPWYSYQYYDRDFITVHDFFTWLLKR